MENKQHIIHRFISYVTVDTESDPNSETTPSTKKQWDLANKLVEELKKIGYQLWEQILGCGRFQCLVKVEDL